MFADLDYYFPLESLEEEGDDDYNDEGLRPAMDK